MSRTGTLACLAVVLLACPCRAQIGGTGFGMMYTTEDRTYPVEVVLKDGQTHSGTMMFGRIEVMTGTNTDAGSIRYSIKPEMVEVLRFEPAPESNVNADGEGSTRPTLVTVVTTTGEEISGALIGLSSEGWLDLETELGTLSFSGGHLESVSFARLSSPFDAPEDTAVAPTRAGKPAPRSKAVNQHTSEEVSRDDLSGRLDTLCGEGWQIVDIEPSRWLLNGDRHEVQLYLIIASRPINSED